jgi:multiple sugar transport system substrate-binding protein
MDRYTSEGKVYGVPYDAQPVVGVFINKKLFEDGGVPVPTNEWSWEDMLQAAKTLTKQQGNRTSQFGLDPGGNWTNWVYAHGGRLVDDYQKPTEVVIDSPEAIAGMRSYVDLFQEQKVSPSPQLLESGGLTSADLFTTGQVAMFHGGYWELVFQPDKFTGLDLGYVMLPVGPSRERAFATGGTCYSVSAGTKDPDLAYEFVKFFMGMPGWKAAAAAAQAIYPPAHIPSYKEVFMAEPDSPVENKDINGQGAEYAIFQPADPAWPEINTKYIAPDVDLMVRGQKPVEETLKGWAERFTPMLTANK